jgi:hypothetical protein
LTAANAANIFYVPAGTYLIQAAAATSNVGAVDSGSYAVAKTGTDLSFLALSTCDASGTNFSDIATGTASYGCGVSHLDGVFYFSTPKYLVLRQYGGRPADSNGVSPYYGSTTGSSVMLSFAKI